MRTALSGAGGGGEAEILTLAVARQRGAGAGTRLLQAGSPKRGNWGRNDVSGSRHRQSAALALYAGLGFAKVGTRKGYFAAGTRWSSGFSAARNRLTCASSARPEELTVTRIEKACVDKGLRMTTAPVIARVLSDAAII